MAATGELSPHQERRRRLHEVLAQQRAMGLDRQAGTTDLIRYATGIAICMGLEPGVYP